MAVHGRNKTSAVGVPSNELRVSGGAKPTPKIEILTRVRHKPSAATAVLPPFFRACSGLEPYDVPASTPQARTPRYREMVVRHGHLHHLVTASRAQ
jgi:hypothetical protein